MYLRSSSIVTDYRFSSLFFRENSKSITHLIEIRNQLCTRAQPLLSLRSICTWKILRYDSSSLNSNISSYTAISSHANSCFFTFESWQLRPNSCVFVVLFREIKYFRFLVWFWLLKRGFGTTGQWVCITGRVNSWLLALSSFNCPECFYFRVIKARRWCNLRVLL